MESKLSRVVPAYIELCMFEIWGKRGFTSEEDNGSGFRASDLVHYRAGIKCVVRKGNRDALFLMTME